MARLQTGAITYDAGGNDGTAGFAGSKAKKGPIETDRALEVLGEDA